MILSRFDLRGDSFVFASTEEQVLATFENSGVAGGWILDLPPDVNDVDFRTITNVHLVLYYDASFSEQVGSWVRAELAAASRDERMLGLAIRFQYPDEFFNFQSTGELACLIDEASLPFNHTQAAVRDLYPNIETTEGVSAEGLTVSLAWGDINASAKTDANGLVVTNDDVLAEFRGRPLVGSWKLSIDRQVNEDAFADGFDWPAVKNIAFFGSYTYSPRGRAMHGNSFTTDLLAEFEIVDDPAAAAGGPGVWSYQAGAKLVRQQASVHDPALLNTGPGKPGARLIGKTNSWPLHRNSPRRRATSAAAAGASARTPPTRA